MDIRQLLTSIIFLVFTVSLTRVEAQTNNLDSFVINKKSRLNFIHSKNNSIKKNINNSFYILNDNKYFGMQFNKTKATKRLELHVQTHNNIEIYSASIKINFDNNGTPILYNDNTINYTIVNKSNFPLVNLISDFSNIKSDDILEHKKIYFPISENEIIPAIEITYKKENKNYLIIFNSKYDIIYNTSLTIEKDITTKTANASIFLPDPITSAETVYGGDFVNNSGATNSSLEAQQIDVAIECKFDGTNYYLENNFVKIQDLVSPSWAVVSNTTGDFSYNRSEIGFQQVNAFYHISKIKEQINIYGFTDAVNYAIKVDADGSNGHDNSTFTPSGNNSYIQYGAYTGVEEHIPDAEDAEVVVHEYTHAIVNSYSPNRTTNERRSLEEGLADYIAVSYATGINSYNWQKVFKWDGNESWNGRKATSTKCYTNIYSWSNIYANTDIWVAPLMDLYFELGKETTDKLVLHTITALSSNTTMEQAALIMMSMDTVYNSNQNSMSIFNAFKNYCILNDSHLANESFNISSFKIINSDAFSKGGEMRIEFENLFSGEINIYNINGITIFNKKLNLRKNFSFNSEDLNSGIYLINIKGNKDSKTIKLCKY